MPRRKKHTPPGLAEDPAQLAAEASEPKSHEGRTAAASSGKAPKPRKAGVGSRAASEGASAPAPELPFPVEAIAILHLELWNAIAMRLRSKYELSPQGAQEMAMYAELCIRQYVGPYLADHAALAGYMLTQVSALVALFALREQPKPPAPAPLAPPPDGQYARPVTAAELRPTVATAA